MAPPRMAGLVRALASASLFALACREVNPDFVEPGTDAGGPSSSATLDEGSETASLDEGSTEASATGESGGAACGLVPPRAGGSTCGDICQPGCPQDLCAIECHASWCAGEVVQCPPGIDCHVHCEDDYACQDATIVCPPEHACHVECDADGACADTVIVCAAGTCLLECQDGDDVCADISFSCGTNDSAVECEHFGTDVEATPNDASSCACEGC